MTILDCLNT